MEMLNLLLCLKGEAFISSVGSPSLHSHSQLKHQASSVVSLHLAEEEEERNCSGRKVPD
jgi:hypothetical protein